MALISLFSSKNTSTKPNPLSKISLKSKLTKSNASKSLHNTLSDSNSSLPLGQNKPIPPEKNYGSLTKENTMVVSTSLSSTNINSQDTSSSSTNLDLIPPSHELSASTSTSNHFDESISTVDRRPGSESFSVNSLLSSPKRILSDKMKATPSSFHRQSRLYSMSLDYLPKSTLTARKSPFLGSGLSTNNLPPQLAPIVNLINCQKLRTYAIGTFLVAGSHNNEKIWIEVEAKLTGNELAIWRPSHDDDVVIETGFDEFRPKYINLVDSKFEVMRADKNSHEIKFSVDYQSENNIAVRFESSHDLNKWVSAILLAKFEYISLNEAYTAVILSLKGAKLSDIHVLLAPKQRFIKHEWINLRLPQISNKWLKVYMLIHPGDSKHLGKIEIYKNDKVQKKNLVAYIPNLSNIYNVYPEQSNMIDFNSIMKLNGEVYVNKQFEYLFQVGSDEHMRPPSQTFSIQKSDSFHSLTNFKSPTSTPMLLSPTHSRNHSGSFQTASSFFNNAPSPSTKDLHDALSQPPKIGGRLRSLSQGSKSHENHTTRSRSSSFVNKNLDQFVTTEYVYIMPITHPGVPVIETMIRNLIPIIDAYKMYGRPQHLNSDKTNPESFLFGLPSLPHFQYLSSREASELVSKNLQTSVRDNWNETKWREVFKKYLDPKMKGGFKGHGDIVDLYSSLDYPEISSPHVQFPRESSPESDYNNPIGNPFNDADSDFYSDKRTSFINNTKETSNEQFLEAPFDFKRQYNSSPLSNSFTTTSDAY